MTAAQDHTRSGAELLSPARLLRLERSLGISGPGQSHRGVLPAMPRCEAWGIASSRHPILQALIDVLAIGFGVFLLSLLAVGFGASLCVLYLSMRS